MVPDGWSYKQLGDTSQVIDCKHRTPPYIDDGVPVVSPGSLRWGSLDLASPKKRVSHDEYQALMDHCTVEVGDLVIGRNQSIGIASYVDSDAPFVLGQDTVLIKPTGSNPAFLFYCLQSAGVQRRLFRLAGGSTFSRINLGELRKLDLLIPPKSEQKKIAEILSTWDRAIEAVEKLIENSQGQKRALAQKLLLGKARLPDFSKTWHRIELGALLDYKQPTAHLVESTEYSDKYETPVLTAGKTFILGYTNETSGIYQEDLPVIIFDDFTTDSKFVDFPFKAKSSAMKILTAKKGISIKYVFEAMQLLKFTVGGHQRHWISIFSNLVIPVPEIEEQHAIASILATADREIEVFQNKLKCLRQEKKALMQQLLTGKRRVKVAEQGGCKGSNGMSDWKDNPFEHGNAWVRADFHLHTKADKEFKYDGKEEEYTAQYVEKLKEQSIRLGVVTNHNKFDKDEFKALRKKARKQGIGLLPGVELSVKDGANGVHTLIVFSDEWLEKGHDYINSFLSSAFHGKVPAQYEQENGRSNDDLLTTLRNLEKVNRDFFVVFAHVEAPSGLWKELGGGRMQELAQEPLIQKYCLGFQKVRTHDKPDAVCRTKVQQWWGGQYPAELEGSDPKSPEEIGRGPSAFLKIGDFSFEAVKYGLTDFRYRTTNEIEPVEHSHVKAIRFEGGMLDGKRIAFSPHLNCLIGIRGSGKSSVLESLRYALDIELGENAEDQEYKKSLLPHVLKSGGKIVVEAVDKHGTEYEIRRIWKEAPDVYVDGDMRPGVSIKGTIISKPLYFGQKDLSKAGKGFGQDLVEKLVGEQLKPIRQKIADKEVVVSNAVKSVLAVAEDAEQKHSLEEELKDVKFQLEQFEKHGVQKKLSKQVEFDDDIAYCASIDELVKHIHEDLDEIVSQADEDVKELPKHESKVNEEFFKKYDKKLEEFTKGIKNTKATVEAIGKLKEQLSGLKKELETAKVGLKEDFAEVERKLIQELNEQGVKSVQPDDFKKLTQRKTELEKKIEGLDKKTAKEKSKQDTLLRAIAALNDAWHEEYKAISGALEQINDAQPALNVEADYKGDKQAFAAKMEQTFRGHSIRKDNYETIAKKYSDFGAVYKDLETAAKEAKSKSETLKQLFVEHLEDFLTFQVPNSFNITYHGKSLKSHSLGQRASAMMLFILSQKENDLLLIDQPEDDLDNQTIYEEVVKLLKDLKPNQQFIFATHNANFPVLGDAELITSCESTEDTIATESGSIDHKEAQQKIVDIMEGGPEAFERRRTIYQLWNSSSQRKGSAA